MTASRRSGVYLDMLSAKDALARFLDVVERAPMPPAERVAVASALGRVTAEPVLAAHSSPHYVAAAMDGFAVRSALTTSAAESAPVRLRIPGQARPVNTGDPIPDGFDAVCKVEDAHPSADGAIEVRQPLAPGAHIRSIGEDVSAGELLLPPNRPIGPTEVGCLLGAGVLEVLVHGQPRVAILPTGSELVRPGEPLAPGSVVEYNSAMLAALVMQWGGKPCLCEPVTDDPDRIWAAMRTSLKTCDLLAVIGGSSAGRGDHVPDVIRQHGELLVHGVRIAPGKPVALGAIGGRPVMGVPGYPVSAWTAFELFARPALLRVLGLTPPQRQRIAVRVQRKIPSHAGVEEFVRVNVGEVGGEWVALPLKRGAGVLSSLMRATALVRVPESSEGIDAGEEVQAELLADLEDLRNDILGAGEYHACLDPLCCALSSLYPPANLRWRRTSADAGLLALRGGEVHVAGVTNGFEASRARQVLRDMRSLAVRVALGTSPNESFVLAVPRAGLETRRVQHLLNVLRSDAFRNQLTALGYDPSATGEVVYEQ